MKKIFNIIIIVIGEVVAIFETIIFYYPQSSFGYFIRAKYCRFKLKGSFNGSALISRGFDVYCNAPLKVGSNFSSGRNVTINSSDSFGIIIGDNVGIAEGSVIRAANHGYTDLDKPFKEQGHIAKKIQYNDAQFASIVIGDDVWIGAGSIILSGANIGKGSIVSAGSIVSGSLPEYSIAVGNPARVVAGRKSLFSSKYHKFP